MKVLVLFADMIRQNRLLGSIGESSSMHDLDYIIQSIGGSFYTNCYTVAPDTPRSLATVFSGNEPSVNGCDRHTKWPQFFMNAEEKNIFEIFYEAGYHMDFLSDPVERLCGVFPQFVLDKFSHNERYSVHDFFKNLKLKENHLVFACFPQFHWTLNSIGASTFGERQGYRDISYAFDTMLNSIDIEEFDHVILFSDHGFKLACELRKNAPYRILDEDRTNVLFLHKQKGQKQISVNDTLCSLIDFKSLCADILNENLNKNGTYSLPEKKYVIIEDHSSFNVGITDSIEQWAVKTRASYYIRNSELGFLKKSCENKFKEEIASDFDKILYENSAFRLLMKIQSYRSIYSDRLKKNYLKESNMYDHRQFKISRISEIYYKVIDLIKVLFKKV